MMSYFVEDWQILPVVGVTDPKERLHDEIIDPLMEFFPDVHHILQKVVPMYMTNIFYHALLEAQASELASRMTAMSAATTNAEKMIKMAEQVHACGPNMQVKIPTTKAGIKAMEEAGLKPELLNTTGVIEQNEQDFKEYLEKNPVPDVALAVRDSMAISFMNIAQKKGIKVPDELQVIGFQNTRYAELSYPKLSCVDTPIYEIGNIAMSELTDLMKDEPEKKPTNIIVDYKEVWRDSTR